MSEGVSLVVQLAMPVEQYKQWKATKLDAYTFKDWGPWSGPHPGELDDTRIDECLKDLRRRSGVYITDKPGLFSGHAMLEVTTSTRSPMRLRPPFGSQGS